MYFFFKIQLQQQLLQQQQQLQQQQSRTLASSTPGRLSPSKQLSPISVSALKEAPVPSNSSVFRSLDYGASDDTQRPASGTSTSAVSASQQQQSPRQPKSASLRQSNCSSISFL